MLQSILNSLDKGKKKKTATLKDDVKPAKRSSAQSYEEKLDAEVRKLREERVRKEIEAAEREAQALQATEDLQALRDEFDASSDSEDEADILGDKPLIDTQDKAIVAVERINSVLKKLSKWTHKPIAVDLEWSGQGRDAKLCLLQLAVPDDLVYLFDFIALNASVFWDAGLKKILESTEILKIFHDCRQDADVLKSYGVQLTNVYDTQIAFALLKQQEGKPVPLPVGLNTVLRIFAGGGVNQHKNDAKAGMMEDATYWEKRPMTETQIGYAREDVLNLPEVYRQLNGAFSQQTIKAVKLRSALYLDTFRNLKKEEYDILRVYDGVPKYHIKAWDNSALENLKRRNRKRKKEVVAGDDTKEPAKRQKLDNENAQETKHETENVIEIADEAMGDTTTSDAQPHNVQTSEDSVPTGASPKPL